VGTAIGRPTPDYFHPSYVNEICDGATDAPWWVDTLCRPCCAGVLRTKVQVFVDFTRHAGWPGPTALETRVKESYAELEQLAGDETSSGERLCRMRCVPR